MGQDDTVTFELTTPQFQLLPMSKVDQSYLNIHGCSAAFSVTKKFYSISCFFSLQFLTHVLPVPLDVNKDVSIKQVVLVVTVT